MEAIYSLVTADDIQLATSKVQLVPHILLLLLNRIEQGCGTKTMTRSKNNDMKQIAEKLNIGDCKTNQKLLQNFQPNVQPWMELEIPPKAKSTMRLGDFKMLIQIQCNCD